MNILVVSESFVIRDSIGHLFIEVFQPIYIKIVSNLEELDNRDLSKMDFAFIDINKNNFEVVETLANIKQVFQKLKIMVLDSSRDRDVFFNSIKLGIDGYIINILEQDEFIYAVNKVISGKKFYDSELLQYIIDKPSNRDTQKLTDRELDVLRQVAKGFSNKDIANNLGVTDYTIKKHVSKILSKFSLRNRQDIIIYAIDNDLLDKKEAN